MNDNNSNIGTQPNTPALTDDQVVDIELAKGRLHSALDVLHQYPTIKTEAMIAKALTNTVREILVEAGVTTDVAFYNRFTTKVEDKIEIVQDMLGVEPVDADATEDTVG